MGDTTLSYAVGNKGAEFSLAGLPSPHRELLLNWGTAAPEAALPSPSSLRDATSPKVRALAVRQVCGSALYALLPQGEPSGVTRRLSAFAKAPTLGELARSAERASPAEAAQGVGLDSANDGADFRKVDLNLRGAFLSAGLPSPSSLRDATSPK
mgnify:CR=1 FL=1